MTDPERDRQDEDAAAKWVMKAVTRALPRIVMKGVSVGPLPLEGAVLFTWSGQDADADDTEGCEAAYDRASTIGRRAAETLEAQGFTILQAGCPIRRRPTRVTYGALVKVAP